MTEVPLLPRAGRYRKDADPPFSFASCVSLDMRYHLPMRFIILLALPGSVITGVLWNTIMLGLYR